MKLTSNVSIYTREIYIPFFFVPRKIQEYPFLSFYLKNDTIMADLEERSDVSFYRIIYIDVI